MARFAPSGRSSRSVLLVATAPLVRVLEYHRVAVTWQRPLRAYEVRSAATEGPGCGGAGAGIGLSQVVTGQHGSACDAGYRVTIQKTRASIESGQLGRRAQKPIQRLSWLKTTSSADVKNSVSVRLGHSVSKPDCAMSSDVLSRPSRPALRVPMQRRGACSTPQDRGKRQG